MTENAQTELPDPQDIVKTYAEVAQRTSKLISEYSQRQSSKGLSMPKDELGLAQAFMDMTAKLFQNPYRLAQAQMNLAWDYFILWQRSMQRLMGMQPQPVVAPSKDDKRFKDEQWKDLFLFDFIKQSYLITARHIHDTFSSVEGLDEKTKQKINFFTRQYIDALAPSNFALTNPEVFRETVRSGGQNLVKGFNNLLRDLDNEEGEIRIRMTDTTAFELGNNVATTPGKVIYQNDLIQLLQYTPTTAEVNSRPVLIVPPWINKYYILDLRDKNSMIKWLVDQGQSVFVISWVNPNVRLSQKNFEDYVKEGVLDAVSAICEQTGASEINAAGYCLGGTLLGTTLAYMAAKNDKRIASATFFTSLLDFSEPGELGVFIDDDQVKNLEKKMAQRGFLEGREMASTFNMLRANDLIWSFVVNNYLLGKDPFPFDLLYWNSDSTRMPAQMHSFYLRNMYLCNNLVKPAGISVLGTPIDLTAIKVPCYFISTVEDHIAPWKSTYLGAKALSAPVRFVLGGSGHIAGIVNPPVANKYGFWAYDMKGDPAKTKTKLPDTAEEWCAGATQHAGSWWLDWQKWLSTLNAKTIPALDPNKGKLKPLEEAPGSYVKARLDRGTSKT